MKQIYNCIKEYLRTNDGLLLLFVIGFIIGITFGYNTKPKVEKEIIYKTPVERIKIDSIYIVRDSIIYKTKYIETIKHDTIEKVYNLSDSSTLELFYKLVSE